MLYIIGVVWICNISSVCDVSQVNPPVSQMIQWKLPAQPCAAIWAAAMVCVIHWMRYQTYLSALHPFPPAASGSRSLILHGSTAPGFLLGATQPINGCTPLSREDHYLRIPNSHRRRPVTLEGQHQIHRDSRTRRTVERYQPDRMFSRWGGAAVVLLVLVATTGEPGAWGASLPGALALASLFPGWRALNTPAGAVHAPGPSAATAPSAGRPSASFEAATAGPPPHPHPRPRPRTST